MFKETYVSEQFLYIPEKTDVYCTEISVNKGIDIHTSEISTYCLDG